MPDTVDVATVRFLLFHLVEQSGRALLLRRGDGEEVATAPPPGVDDASDLVVRVKSEVPSRLSIGRIENRVLDDDRFHDGPRGGNGQLSSCVSGESDYARGSGPRPEVRKDSFDRAWPAKEGCLFV